MPYKEKFPKFDKKLYWRVACQFTKLVPFRIRIILDLISENRKLFCLCDTDLLYIIATTMDKYTSSNRLRIDLETIKEMIEAIEKHGEIELFYEY